MKKHFPKLRRLLKSLAVIGPVTTFAAFICYAGGLIGSTLMFSIAFIGLLMLLPIQLFTSSNEAAPSPDPFKLPAHAAAVLLFLWLIGVPEFRALFGKLGEKGLFMDFRPISAGVIWTLCAIYKHMNKVDSLSDRDIYRCISRKPAARSKNPNRVPGSD